MDFPEDIFSSTFRDGKQGNAHGEQPRFISSRVHLGLQDAWRTVDGDGAWIKKSKVVKVSGVSKHLYNYITIYIHI